MMIQPTPGVLDQLIRERQEQLRGRDQRTHAHHASTLRVRIGHVLIAAGSALSGERVERSARPRVLSRAA